MGEAPTTSEASKPATARIELFGWTDTGIERSTVATVAEAMALSERYRHAWIDVEGISAIEAVNAMEAPLGIAPLACDTLVEGIRRPGADDFDDITIVTMRAHLPGGDVEFVDFLLTPRVLVTIQEKVGGDAFDGVRERLSTQSPRMIRADVNVVFLLLGRAVCDGYRPLLERFSTSLEKLERALVRHPDSSMLDRIHRHRRDLLFLRQGLAPLREALANLQSSLVARQEDDRRFRARLAALRELQDELGALLDLVEFQKDSAQHLLDLYLNAASNRLNEIVRVLTIISVIFMPLTLIAGIYGMNFEHDGPWAMPELRWRFGYPFALGLMALSVVSFLIFFWRKGWIGDPMRRRTPASNGTSSLSVLTGNTLESAWPLSVMLSRRKSRASKSSRAPSHGGKMPKDHP
ncbi:MAG: magnesium/cobalt transporter CorA [Planctomycetaceae bacterium]|nr:magnesium/cobalt transporter CorA [Planctomycetaceae bacterium]